LAAVAAYAAWVAQYENVDAKHGPAAGNHNRVRDRALTNRLNALDDAIATWDDEGGRSTGLRERSRAESATPALAAESV
jgi:hypothetical protein